MQALLSRIQPYREYIRQIIRLALPITLGQLGLIMMGFTDIVMLGHYDTLSMSAAGVGNAVFFLFALIGIGTLYALSTIVSIADGEGKPQQAIPAFRSSLWVSLILSGMLMQINEILYHHFDIFGQSEGLGMLSKNYLRIVNFSIPGLMFYNNGKQLLDGLGKTRVSMYVTFFGLILNILLNYMLIFGKLGVDEMGLSGAAWATTISRYVMAVLMLVLAWYDPLVNKLRQMKFENKSYLLSIFRIGLPVGFTYFFEIAAFSYALILAGKISDLHSGAHQIAINLASITYMLVMGISVGTGIVVGNNYGARNLKGIRNSATAALIIAVIVEVIFALVFLLFNESLPMLYTDDPKLLALTPGLLILAAFFQIGDGLQAVAAGALRGIKDTSVTGFIAFISYWVIMMPGAYLLCFNLGLGINGIWISFVVGLTFAAVCLIYRFYRKTRPGMEFSDES